ncbi:hypothetical protein REH81_15275, partial [Vibrio rotiferianus]
IGWHYTMKWNSIRTTAALLLMISSCYADNYLPVDNIKDHYNKSITQVSIPSGIKTDQGTLISGLQDLDISVDGDSTTSLSITANGTDYQIKPGQSITIQVDFAHGKEDLSFDLKPTPAVDGSLVKYTINIPHPTSIYGPSGWQEIYSDPGGCQQEDGCNTDEPYGSFSQTKIAYNQPSNWRCTLGGVPGQNGQCQITIYKDAVAEACPEGYESTTTTCFKKETMGWIYNFACPHSHRYYNYKEDVTKQTKCYKNFENDVCPEKMVRDLFAVPGRCRAGIYSLNSEQQALAAAGKLDCKTASNWGTTPYLIYDVVNGKKKYYCGTTPQMYSPPKCQTPGFVLRGPAVTGCVGGGYVSPTKYKDCEDKYATYNEMTGLCERNISTKRNYSCTEGKLVNNNKCEKVENRGSPEEYCEDSSDSPVQGRCINESISTHEVQFGGQKVPKYTTQFWVK